jgi:uncharacterized protein (UPF0335 family)
VLTDYWLALLMEKAKRMNRLEVNIEITIVTQTDAITFPILKNHVFDTKCIKEVIAR